MDDNEKETEQFLSKAHAQAVLDSNTSAMIAYLEESEQKHYEEEPVEGHIFLIAQQAHSAMDYLNEVE